MRSITQIIIHCSATPEGKDFSLKDIDRWYRERGFKMVGYHYVIHLDGTIEQGRPLEMIGAHCTGHNAHSIGICYIGGLDRSGNPKDTRTQVQKDVLWSLVKSLQKRFSHKGPSGELVEPTVHGHKEFANKACPCFEVKEEFC